MDAVLLWIRKREHPAAAGRVQSRKNKKQIERGQGWGSKVGTSRAGCQDKQLWGSEICELEQLCEFRVEEEVRRTTVWGFEMCSRYL